MLSFSVETSRELDAVFSTMGVVFDDGFLTLTLLANNCLVGVVFMDGVLTDDGDIVFFIAGSFVGLSGDIRLLVGVVTYLLITLG